MIYSKKATTYLESGNRDLQFILTKVKILQQINQKISSYLEPAIASLCQVANLVSGRLILLVADGSIATQIRFQQADLLRKFKFDADARIQQITEIHCKVSPTLLSSNRIESRKKPKKMQAPTPETADIMRGIAESLDDPVLKEILERIAERGR